MPEPDRGMEPVARVLFVCLGNICRSPTAEAVFRSTVERAGLAPHIRIDSAGTGDWHVGRPPDPRAIAAARRRGYDLTGLRGRQVRRRDFAEFDWIFAMDHANLAGLTRLRPPEWHGHLGLFLDLVDGLGVSEVPDPYAGGHQEFERMLDLIEQASEALLAHLQARVGGPLVHSRR